MRTTLRYGDVSRLSDPEVVTKCIKKAAELEAAKRTNRRKCNCQLCGSGFHARWDCPGDPRSSKRWRRDSSEGEMMIVQLADSTDEDDFWIISSATTVHVANNTGYFVELRDPVLSARPQYVNGVLLDPSQVIGMGRVELETRVNERWQTVRLDDVYYVPGLPNSAFSPLQARRQHISVIMNFERGSSAMMDGRLHFQTSEEEIDRFYTKLNGVRVFQDNRRVMKREYECRP